MRVRGLVLLVSAVSLLAGTAFAQSLGEVAAREKERKEREGRKAKVFTESDLRGKGTGTVSQPGAVRVDEPAAKPAATGESGTPEATKEKVKTEEELRAEREQEWRQKVEQARAEVERLQKLVGELQTALNDLTQNLYGGTRTGLLNQMDQARKDLAAAQQKVADLEEEGRRSRYR